jgi:PIN domain nuclease of toxin-antitoxin system
MEKALIDLALVVSPITLEVAERQMALPFHHRDPLTGFWRLNVS